ncbi:hypothetical protein DFR70_112189 [Nocardia tenerifensis]|uniref:Uncharacterized protein n=1 Tax=Nocardia tenerifensis TaxID=228006 RepID=A0A318JUE0_9NOCA|nr:hypothetical protein [Nocardia tenerifensis]PXX59272.1 hypothetical protein DFR70_112189 [Nocardia tenerifensis]
MLGKSVAMGFAVLAVSGVATMAGAGHALANAPQTSVYPGLSPTECAKVTADARRNGAATAMCLPDGSKKQKAVITYR